MAQSPALQGDSKMHDWSWKMPRHVPTFSHMWHALGKPPVHLVAKSFGVTAGTVRRWLRDDRAPRHVLLSVFWLTHWGQAEIAGDAVYRAQLLDGLNAALRRENAALWARVGRLEALGGFGSANAPSYEAPRLQVWGS